MNPIQILLVDDHEVVLSGVSKLLSDNPHYHITRTAKNQKEAITILQNNLVDIAIIDLALPEFGGIELQNKITEYSPATKTIIFSMHDTIWVINELIENGINGYVSKASEFKELKIAIEEVLKGNTYFCTKTTKTYHHHKILEGELKNRKLTSKENEIVQLIYKEFKIAQIAKKMNMSKRSVNAHLKIIMEKLQLENSIGIIKKSALSSS